MKHRVWLSVGFLVAACSERAATTSGGSAVVGAFVAPAHAGAELAAELAIARAGCCRCHAPPAARADRLAPVPGPDLAADAPGRGADAAAFLRGHHGGDCAPDLAAWLVADASATPAAAAGVSSATLARGERIGAEQACRGCHAPADLAAFAARFDPNALAGFLAAPTAHWPGLAHLALAPDVAAAAAAWLLRDRLEPVGAAPAGFACDCYPMPIESSDPPDLRGAVAAATTVVDRIDGNATDRRRDFALDFHAELTVPASGEWTFTIGSDDGSWLWIDEVMVVANGQIAPHRRRSAKVTLTAGPHALRVLFTQAAGGKSLEVLWAGPGTAEQELPAASARAVVRRWQPWPARPVADAAAAARGRDAAAARGCVACHAGIDAGPPPPARPLADLGGGACPQVDGAAGILAAARATFAAPRTAADDLAFALRRDGCLACHARAGEGGLPPAARAELATIEDLGDEGRLPPDLTAVGHRLRAAWIERLLVGDVVARPYVRLAHPHLAPERAQQFAAWFAAVDGRPGDDDEPAFSVDAAEQGRKLAGLGGRNCITCHTFAGHRALGPQGMDLALQHERLRPAWFAEWVLAPNVHRPATRMIPMWSPGDANGPRDVAAIRTWLSLGAAAPLPAGVVVDGAALALEPVDRPILHGAFLKNLSARCLAVGSPLRTHWAFDLANPRLAWLWRGAFLDASGTWVGRAGELLEPAGQDWLVLEDLGFADGGGASARRLIGQWRTADGYPVLRVGVGTAAYEDEVRARLAAGGSEVVRTVRCVQGSLRVVVPPAIAPLRVAVVGGEPTGGTLTEGQHLELVYRW